MLQVIAIIGADRWYVMTGIEGGDRWHVLQQM